ncbi:ER membrane protein complex subunit 5-like [Halichondria panicea]|uniref:ER membrane protein complex subunit 5-like n=1 Tax=Halichondria panicea TaxID=6063 RepID=UPI00312BBA0E
MVLRKAVLVLGFILLGHSAFSAEQHRSFLKLAEEEYSYLPKDIAFECLMASVLCVFGVLSLMGKFKDIKLTTELNTQSFETVDNRLGFMTFNHRCVS